MKKIFLSGGSGFIGRNILEHFGESYEIDAPGHSALPLEDADKVAAYFAHKQYDVIIHAAVKPYHRMAEDKNSV
ncbi:MAG: sugar nucleotide-binding protein, partial [Eubacteriales bacterium]